MHLAVFCIGQYVSIVAVEEHKPFGDRFDCLDQLLFSAPAVGYVLCRAEEAEIFPSRAMFRAQLDMNPAGLAVRSYPAVLNSRRRSRRDRVVPRLQKLSNVFRVDE